MSDHQITTPKRRRGRVVAEGETAKDKLIAIRVPLELHAAVASAAGEGESVGAWVRDAIAEKLGQPSSVEDLLLEACNKILKLETELARVRGVLTDVLATAEGW